MKWLKTLALDALRGAVARSVVLSAIVAFIVSVWGQQHQAATAPGDCKSCIVAPDVVDRGELTIVKPPAGLHEVEWACTDARATLVPTDGQAVGFSASRAGEVWFACAGKRRPWYSPFSAVEIHTHKIAVGGPPPPGPAPGPSPSPTPPTPPQDPLLSSLRYAFKTEPDPNKRQQLELLAAIYREAKPFDERFATWGSLFGAMTQAAEQLGVKGKLPNVQIVLMRELSRILPTDSATALDLKARTLAFEQFQRLAGLLEQAD